MSDSPKKTPAPKGTKENLFQLMGYHHRAVELRYQGSTYKDIMGTIAMEFRRGISESTVKKWFMRGGLLNQEYLEYAKAENLQRRQMMREELKKLVSKVPIVLDSVLSRKDETGQSDMVALQGVKLVVEIMGISGEEEPGSGSVLAEYFERLDKVTIPEQVKKPEAVAP